MIKRVSVVLIPLLTTALVVSAVNCQPPAPRSSKLIQQNLIAQPAPPDCPVAATAAIAGIPDDADLIIVVEHASELRASPMGEAVSRFLADTTLVDDLTKAWSRLADQLGLTRDEAFDRLLGQRVVLVSRSAAGGKDRVWAILSDITVDTDEKLRDKLQAAPRAIDQGHNILTIENGQYQLTSHVRTRASAIPGQTNKISRPRPTDPVTLILGPAAKPELFDEMLTVLSRAGNGGGVPGANANVQAVNTGAPGSISAHEVFAQACQAGPAEVLILAALDPIAASAAPGSVAPAVAPVSPADRWKNFVLLAGHREIDPLANDADQSRAGMWQTRVVVRQTSRRDELLKIEPTSDASFRALSKGALVAMMQNAPLPDVLGGWAPSFTNILSIVPIPEDARKQMSPRQALCVRALPPSDRVSCTVARCAPATEQLARTLDPEISAGIQRIEKQFGAEAPPPQDYAGLAPNAVRTTELACSQNGGLSVFSARPLTVSWAYPSQVAVNGPANLNDQAVKVAACAAPGQPPDRAGWWVMNIAQAADANSGAPRPPPSPAELLRSDANALLTVDPNAQTARWVWLASARPAALEALLPSVFPDWNGARSALRRFEWIDLRLQITDPGDIQGDLSLRLNNQPAPPAPK